MTKRKLSELTEDEFKEFIQRAISNGNDKKWKEWVDKNGSDHAKKHGATLSIGGCLVLDSRKEKE